jgi:phage gpG-like protein
MAEIIVQFEGLEELKKKLKSETAAGPCRKFLDRSGRSIVSKAKPLVPVNTGRLRKSLLSTVSNETPVPLSVTVGTNVTYAPFVEFGRKPGRWPPDAAIRTWVTQKNRGRLGTRDPEALDRMTFQVRRAIGRRGVKERPFLRDGTEAAIPAIQAHVTTLGKEIEEAYRRGSL